jgi:hypothetical protein
MQNNMKLMIVEKKKKQGNSQHMLCSSSPHKSVDFLSAPLALTGHTWILNWSYEQNKQALHRTDTIIHV